MRTGSDRMAGLVAKAGTAKASLSHLLDGPAVSTALPMMRLDEQRRLALLEGRPAPMSSLAIQAESCEPVTVLESGVSSEVLQRVADQDLASLRAAKPTVIKMSEAPAADVLPEDEAALTTPIEDIDEDDDPIAVSETEAGGQTADAAASAEVVAEPEQTPSCDEPVVDDTRPCDFATLFTRWRRCTAAA